MSRLSVTMSLTWAISIWLLVTYVLIASASISDEIVPFCVRQPSTQLRFGEHQERYQETVLQATVQSTSPALSLTAPFNLASRQLIDNGTVYKLSTQLATHTNTTQVAKSLGGLDLAEGPGESRDTPNEEQRNDMSKTPDKEECLTGFDTLDCEDCGGPEHTWEIAHNVYHCKGIDAENYRWKDCYCLWDDPAHVRGPCTFDTGSDDGSSQHDPDSNDVVRHAPDSNNDAGHDSDWDDDFRHDPTCEAED